MRLTVNDYYVALNKTKSSVPDIQNILWADAFIYLEGREGNTSDKTHATWLAGDDNENEITVESLRWETWYNDTEIQMKC